MKTTFSLALAALSACAVLPAAAQETITYPSRASDLAHDSYWSVSEFGEGCCILDFNVRRWDDGSWQKGSGNDYNWQNYDWNLPLYAPANGEIIACWRNYPDNTHPGADRQAGVDNGGNHVAILTDEDNVIWLKHFKSGTILSSLCPSNSGSQQFPATETVQGIWRLAYYVNPGDRVRVQEGDYLGRVGSSGQSTGPHLHMEMYERAGMDAWGRETVAGPIPMRFRNGWGHVFEGHDTLSSSSWHRHRGEGLTGNVACPEYQENAPECDFRHIHASPYLRRADTAAGAIKTGGDVLFLSANRAVTATVAENNDHLRLIVWDLVGVDAWEREGDLDGPAIQKVVLSEPNSNYVLAALHLANDNLRMIAYQVTGPGNFVEVADYDAGEISELEVARVGSRTVTAVRTAEGDLKLIAWELDFANNGTVTIDRLGETSTGPASRIAIASARQFTGVYTALRNSGGNLMVIPWDLTSDGMDFIRGDDVTSGTAGTEISVAPLADGVAVAMRDGSGNLQLKTWTASGIDIGSLRSTASAGEVSEVSLLTTPLGESNLTTPVRDSDGYLSMIGWAVADDGTNLRRLGSVRTSGAATGIAADSVERSYSGLDPRDMIATVMRASDGDLRLIAWDTNLVNP